MQFKVVTAWRATYADPIRVKAGDAIHLTGRHEDWDGHIWLWARSASGLEGWAPDSIVKETRDGHVAKEDDAAAELTCRVGEVVSREKEPHGWALRRSAFGAVGWAPRKNLAPYEG